jgi:hypothetical protein
MKSGYFNPNWRMINRAINSGNDGLYDLRRAEQDLKMKIQSKVDAYFKAKREKEAQDAVDALKALPVGSMVYFIGRSDKIKFGTACEKKGDRRTRMDIVIKGEPYDKIYNCPYSLLRAAEPTEQQRKDFNLGVHLSNIFNKAINHYSNGKA